MPTDANAEPRIRFSCHGLFMQHASAPRLNRRYCTGYGIIYHYRYTVRYMYGYRILDEVYIYIYVTCTFQLLTAPRCSLEPPMSPSEGHLPAAHSSEELIGASDELIGG